MNRIELRETLCDVPEHIIEVTHVASGRILCDVPEHIIEVNHVYLGQILCDVLMLFRDNLSVMFRNT
jgi:hypothetical protein